MNNYYRISVAINLPSLASLCSVCGVACVWGSSGVASERGGLTGIPAEEGGPAVVPADGEVPISGAPCGPSNEKKEYCV